MKLGITGHQKLDGLSWEWTTNQLEQLIQKRKDGPTGISSLAKGADQIFIEIIMKNDHNFIVVLPFPNLERTFKAKTDKEKFKKLLKKAKDVITLPKQNDDEVSFYNDGKKVVDLSDEMIAVWNEKPAEGLGGTGDIVKYDQQKKITINILNHYTKQVKSIS